MQFWLIDVAFLDDRNVLILSRATAQSSKRNGNHLPNSEKQFQGDITVKQTNISRPKDSGRAACGAIHRRGAITGERVQ
jgi:hypothetical protein